MLSNGARLVYWDACVPLSYINGIVDRLPHIQGLLADSTIQLVTSILSITEVSFAKAEQDGKALSPETEQAINSLWETGSPIETVEFYGLIAEEAKGLMRAGLARGWSLKPADAIHLATADRLQVSEFHTYDDAKLAKYQELTKTKFPIIQPIATQAVLVPPVMPASSLSPNANPEDDPIKPALGVISNGGAADNTENTGHSQSESSGIEDDSKANEPITQKAGAGEGTRTPTTSRSADSSAPEL